MFETAKEQEILLNRIAGRKAYFKDGITKAEELLQIDKDIRSYYIILSEGNIGKLALEEHLRQIKQLKRVGVLLLTSGNHLNSYEEPAHWSLNKCDFDSFDALIEDAFGS